jgi:hypothetical protein
VSEILLGLAVVLCLAAVIYLAPLSRPEAKDKPAAVPLVPPRHAALIRKYGDTEIAHRIIAGHCWIGQTRGQLIDALEQAGRRITRLNPPRVTEQWNIYHPNSSRLLMVITLTNSMVSQIDLHH